ncbi:hypothetical protein [uncultured Duncaniella sp.]|nr:hypothetical protein [uncultured Duncaniella sp.]
MLKIAITPENIDDEPIAADEVEVVVNHEPCVHLRRDCLYEPSHIGW